MRYALHNGTTIEITEWGSRIRLRDGSEVLSIPHDTPEYRATAMDLGYGDDTLRMAQEHDAIHAILADFLGLEESPALRVSAGFACPGDLAIADEGAVFALTRFAKMCGVDILKNCLKRSTPT